MRRATGLRNQARSAVYTPAGSDSESEAEDVPVPRAYKTDESFLEKIAIGARGTRFVLDDLARQGHDPIELERGSTSFKIWKAIKIKRVRVPDILCLRCGRRVESRAKRKVEITMSHSTTNPERGWDFGLDDSDLVALVRCEASGEGPLDWVGRYPVQYLLVLDLREAWQRDKVKIHKPKGAQEGFEIRVTWPAAIATAEGRVEAVTETHVRYRHADSRTASVRLERGTTRLLPAVTEGDAFAKGEILASFVPVRKSWPCEAAASLETFIAWSESASLAERYAAMKALGRLHDEEATGRLVERMQDTREHIYVRLEAAAGVMRRGDERAVTFFQELLMDDYLENRLEAVIVLGEVATSEGLRLLTGVLTDSEQHHEIRAGAAWALGEAGSKEALPSLVASFAALEPGIKIEGARALAKLARRHLGDVVRAFPPGTEWERPGIAWALAKAGGFSVSDVLPMLVDDDARRWVAYMVGTQEGGSMVPGIEDLARRDPEVYFAVTVLWKIISSWVYGLEEY